MRALLLLLLVSLATLLCAQETPAGEGSALSFSRSVNVPLNGVQLYDKALDAWNWTFGREPGAKLLQSKREDGTLDGFARFNFRSAMLTMREESMGTVQYKVVIRIVPGECRVLVTELVHSGNASTSLGGVHIGPISRGKDPLSRTPGLSRSNAQRLLAELQERSIQRVEALLNGFEARLRASAEP
ncbi:MAG TPA: hypothetical protein PLL25_09805 [Flavobacteriales bacterium]|nr:hypothetical protein [Flavobacteriales bacterium]